MCGSYAQVVARRSAVLVAPRTRDPASSCQRGVSLVPRVAIAVLEGHRRGPRRQASETPGAFSGLIFKNRQSPAGFNFLCACMWTCACRRCSLKSEVDCGIPIAIAQHGRYNFLQLNQGHTNTTPGNLCIYFYMLIKSKHEATKLVICFLVLKEKIQKHDRKRQLII